VRLVCGLPIRLTVCLVCLKGPKHEIFEAFRARGFYTNKTCKRRRLRNLAKNLKSRLKNL
jgi:hypothetical protein